MALYPHQREACRRILSHYASGCDGFILADAPGVGKTYVAVAVADALGGSATVLCPATLVTMWREMLPGATAYSYEYYRRNRPLLGDFVILDEAHRVKNARAQVSTALREALRGRRRLLLTGTPFQLGPAELAHLVYLAGGEHRRILEFGRQVETFWGRRWIWAAPPATVGEWLRAQPWWLRRELSSVAQYLPPMAQRWHTLPDSATYSTAARQVAEELERAAAEDPRHAETLRALACGLLPEGDVDMPALMQRLSTARRLVAEAKAGDVAAYVRSALEDGERQVVVFMHHSEALRAVSTALRAPVITGDTPAAERQRAQQEFSRGAPVLVCSIRAAGEGLNLNTAHMAVFGEYDWNPAVNAQCEARIRRVTDTLPKRAVYLVAPSVVDMLVARAARTRRRRLDSVLHAASERAENLEENLSDKIKSFLFL